VALLEKFVHGPITIEQLMTDTDKKFAVSGEASERE
jgi:hypothetical protein